MKTQLLYFNSVLILFSCLFVFSANANKPVFHKKTDIYSVNAKIQKLKNNTSYVAIIQIEPSSKLHCNLEYPWKVKILSTEHINTSKAVFKKEDAQKISPKEVMFKIPFETKSMGKKLDLQVKFSMCDDKQCFMEKITISLPIK